MLIVAVRVYETRRGAQLNMFREAYIQKKDLRVFAHVIPGDRSGFYFCQIFYHHDVLNLGVHRYNNTE